MLREANVNANNKMVVAFMVEIISAGNPTKLVLIVKLYNDHSEL